MTFAPFTRSFALRTASVLGCICALGALSACSDSDDDEAEGTNLSFFVTSTQHEGNLNGLTGADKICQDLAVAAGASSKTWKAYLSAANGGTPIHAKDRIGTGPWYNAAGVKLADNLTALHALTGNADLFITEKGEKVPGQWNAAMPNEHDVMTGSSNDGTLIMTMDAMTGMPVQTTCNDWTSNTLTPGPQVGHTDGMGPMMATNDARFISWNGGHPARGCAAADLAMSGSTGRLYCFASN
ncbi:MAG: hypothetical protein ABI895_37195 [Deltaproteobacteria bacterium]